VKYIFLTIFQGSIKPYIKIYFKVFSYLLLLCILTGFLIAQFILSHLSGSWGAFHYYLGAKYLHELSYFHLYSCAIKAEPVQLGSIPFVRDLSTYMIVRSAHITACPLTNFSATQWQSFVKDVKTFTHVAPNTFRKELFFG